MVILPELLHASAKLNAINVTHSWPFPRDALSIPDAESLHEHPYNIYNRAFLQPRPTPLRPRVELHNMHPVRRHVVGRSSVYQFEM
jgi:hypothetical protein